MQLIGLPLPQCQSPSCRPMPGRDTVPSTPGWSAFCILQSTWGGASTNKGRTRMACVESARSRAHIPAFHPSCGPHRPHFPDGTPPAPLRHPPPCSSASPSLLPSAPAQWYHGREPRLWRAGGTEVGNRGEGGVGGKGAPSSRPWDFIRRLQGDPGCDRYWLVMRGSL